MENYMFLNDNETFTNINGCIILDSNGIAYDAEQIFHRIPISMLNKCRIGMGADVLKADKLKAEGSWPL